MWFVFFFFVACSHGVLTGNACYCLSLGNCDELGKRKLGEGLCNSLGRVREGRETTTCLQLQCLEWDW